MLVGPRRMCNSTYGKWISILSLQVRIAQPSPARLRGNQATAARGGDRIGCVALFVISGVSAAGKSTVARLLAGRFARGVCVHRSDHARARDGDPYRVHTSLLYVLRVEGNAASLRLTRGMIRLTSVISPRPGRGPLPTSAAARWRSGARP